MAYGYNWYIVFNSQEAATARKGLRPLWNITLVPSGKIIMKNLDCLEPALQPFLSSQFYLIYLYKSV